MREDNTPTGTGVTFALDTEHWQLMLQQVESTAPNEACGLVGGHINAEQYQARIVVPTRNIHPGPFEYQVDPLEQIEAFRQFEESGLELVAIYHSHPGGSRHPSPTDIARAFYPDCVYLIWNKQGGIWDCNGFQIRDGEVTEVPLVIKQ